MATGDLQRPSRSREIGKSGRSQRFLEASAHYWGEQYEHLEPWNTEESRDLQLRDRQPAVIIRMIYSAVNTVNSYLFGSGRLPQFRVTAIYDEDGQPIPEAELQKTDIDELKRVNQEISKIRRSTRFDRNLSELGRCGLLHGTVALAGHQLESGTSWSEIIQVADSFPKFARQDRLKAELLGLREDDLLELDEYWIQRTSTLAEQDKLTLHRRLWTTDATTEHLPFPLDEGSDDIDLTEIEWQIDGERTVVHSLGFVPVVWIRNIRIAGDIDGAPIVGAPEFLFEHEVNYTLSQVGSALRYNGEPQVVFRDVANVSQDPANKLRKGSNKSINIESFGAAGSAPADAFFLEINGAGQRVAMDYVSSLRKMFQQITRVIEHDPEKAVGALSAVAIERLMMPLISLVDTLRTNYGADLSRWFELMLRLSDESLDGFEVSAIWPAIIEPSASELQSIAAPIADLWERGLITLETAVLILAPFFHIDDVEGYLVKLANEGGRGGTSSDGAASNQTTGDPGLVAQTE